MAEKMVLYSYWRSSASFRVRIALNLKGLKYDIRPVNLLEHEQQSDEYRTVNPQGLVPALYIPQTLLMTQSMAIMEYLDEAHPMQSPLLPHLYDTAKRFFVRQFADIIACDIHPLQNLRVKNALQKREQMYQFAESQQQRVGDRMWKTWCEPWVLAGFNACERLVDPRTDFCFGDAPGMADCCLIPQIYNAARMNFDLAPFPRLMRVYENCMGLDAFRRAAPENQPDAVQ